MQIILSNDVTFQASDDEAVLLDNNGDTYYELDPVGTRLWQLLSHDGDFERALAQLLQEFEVEEAELRTDLLALLDDMADAGLVAVESAAE